jgi:hypothetical protein
VTGSSFANPDNIFPPGFKRKLGIKGYYTLHFTGKEVQAFRYRSDRLGRNISIFLLNPL